MYLFLLQTNMIFVFSRLKYVKNVNFIFFSFQRPEYFKIIWRYIQLITAGHVPYMTSLFVSIMHF